MPEKDNFIRNVSIKGISSAVPKKTVNLKNHSDKAINVERIINSTGIENIRVASKDMCASDLCYESAMQLIKELNWDPASIDLLVFITQTPDYKIPATSCILQARLGLSKNCAAFDINLGCSGYIYGLNVVYNFLCQGKMKRALLLVGDTSSKLVSPFDMSTYFLFGDAGTATALEQTSLDNPAYFSLHTNGEGCN
jgi:3-oxoacyl-[acyl-carrier-protein] synthase-3